LIDAWSKIGRAGKARKKELKAERYQSINTTSKQ
jgi:hypothetical protein